MKKINLIITSVILTCYTLMAQSPFSSPTHKKYSGQIVFSKSTIDFKAPNESEFTNSFSITDDIHFRVYMPNTFKKLSGHNIPIGEVRYGIIVNGKTFIEDDDTFNQDQWNNWSTYRNQLFYSTPLSLDEAVSTAAIPFEVALLAIRNYGSPVKVEVIAQDQISGNVFAKGSLTISGVTKTFQKSRYKKAGFDLPASSGLYTKDALIKAFTATRKKVLNPLDAVSTSNWSYTRNELTSAIINRYLEAQYIYMDTEENKCYSRKFFVIEPYTGSSYGTGEVYENADKYVLPAESDHPCPIPN